MYAKYQVEVQIFIAQREFQVKIIYYFAGVKLLETMERKLLLSIDFLFTVDDTLLKVLKIC